MTGIQYVLSFLYNGKIWHPLYSGMVLFIYFVVFNSTDEVEIRLSKFLLITHYILSIVYLVTFLQESYTCYRKSEKNKKEMRKGKLDV